MASDVFPVLVRLSVIATLSILVVALLRASARRAVGSEAAYWLWLLVPASLIAVLLPRAPAYLCGPDSFLGPVLIRWIGAPLDYTPGIAINGCALPVTLTWVIGASITLLSFICCQRVLIRSLSPLQSRGNGTHCSSAAEQPMLVGGWHPRIVLPSHFETRYSEVERALILAHERAHVERNDARTNSVACALVCLFWFNPLVYWAWSRFRFDQEAACDAAVLRQERVSRRRYAQALARTHVATGMEVAFGWRRRHALVERIEILRRPKPSRPRRLAGYALALALMHSGAYVVWAARPNLPMPAIDANRRIALDPSANHPVFSPDGHRLAFGTGDPTEKSEKSTHIPVVALPPGY